MYLLVELSALGHPRARDSGVQPAPAITVGFPLPGGRDENAIWGADCAKLLVDATYAVRARVPGICIAYAAQPAAEKPATPAEATPPKPEDAERVQRIEIVSMPSQKVAITDMPKPGRLTVDVEAWPAMTTETTVTRHPNSDEITKTVATSRMTDKRA
ncbi:MAG: hypothetical protein HZT41_10580 [Dechloromonas sp.]|nr:MAG: hypothetical protein HZT41_10580 [Dechloromonas sp.]